jgi:hypothetical protein
VDIAFVSEPILCLSRYKKPGGISVSSNTTATADRCSTATSD